VTDSAASGLIWHYTTTAGLRGVLVDHKLRATSVSFVNDPSEQQLGRQALLSALEDLLSRPDRERDATEMHGWLGSSNVTLTDQFGFSNRFVACASEAADSLELWRGYGAGAVAGTYAIGLQRDSPLALLASDAVRKAWFKRNDARSPYADGMRDGWTRVNYTTEEELKSHVHDQLLRGLDDIHETSWPDRQLLLWRLVDRVLAEVEADRKHAAYSAEREVRLSVGLRTLAAFHLQERGLGVSAFVELTAGNEWGDIVTEPVRLPVREVIAWPGAPSQARAGIAAALHQGGHNFSGAGMHDRSEPEVAITHSRVPFV
jgi:hypothetical protein